MPHLTTRRFYNIFGKKLARYFHYRRAKKLYNEISREMCFLEARFMKSRLHHA